MARSLAWYQTGAQVPTCVPTPSQKSRISAALHDPIGLIRQTLTPGDGRLELDLSAHPELAGQALEIIVRRYAPFRRPPGAPASTRCRHFGKVVGDPEKDAMIDAALDAWLTTGRFNGRLRGAPQPVRRHHFALTVNSARPAANLVAFSTSPHAAR